MSLMLGRNSLDRTLADPFASIPNNAIFIHMQKREPRPLTRIKMVDLLDQFESVGLRQEGARRRPQQPVNPFDEPDVGSLPSVHVSWFCSQRRMVFLYVARPVCPAQIKAKL